MAFEGLSTEKIDEVLSNVDDIYKENIRKAIVEEGDLDTFSLDTMSNLSVEDTIKFATSKKTFDRTQIVNLTEEDLLKIKKDDPIYNHLTQDQKDFILTEEQKEFLELHAQSRMIENIDETVEKIITAANNLAGEQFDLTTAITALSGGQSRALMIADTAILSSSPIVLIDEIENAGIDRKKALELLVSSDKIVLMATHDPTLALIADKRIIIKNGGIAKIIETSQEEKKILSKLEEMDNVIQKMRTDLRLGKILSE